MQAQTETRLQNPELQQSNTPARQQNKAHQSETISILASGSKTCSPASPPASLLINCHVNNNSNNEDNGTARQHKKCHAPIKKEMPSTRRYSQCWKIGTGNKNQFHAKDQNEGGESSNPNTNKKLDYLKNIQIVSNKDRKDKKSNVNENVNSPNLNGRGKNLMQQTFVEYHPVGQCKSQKLTKQSAKQTFSSNNNNGKVNPNSMKAKIFQKIQNKANGADLEMEMEKEGTPCLSQDIKAEH